jgi:2-C-methyl-D-erythritol 4-phosphate cytidylyltransferase
MISAILLAGGIGTRMGRETPKQFLPLANVPIAQYSFDVLCGHPLIDEVVVVCDEKYQSAFSHPKAVFANPGERRQDSVQSGLSASSPLSEFICIHDSARPFITSQLVTEVVEAARLVGAAAPGVPLKFTIKEVNSSGFAVKTPDRGRFLEIQTPQVMRRELLAAGFEMSAKHNLTVTDDVSLAELLEHPVKLVKGSHMNIKITTNEDLTLAESYVQAN